MIWAAFESLDHFFNDFIFVGGCYKLFTRNRNRSILTGVICIRNSYVLHSEVDFGPLRTVVLLSIIPYVFNIRFPILTTTLNYRLYVRISKSKNLRNNRNDFVQYSTICYRLYILPLWLKI